MDSPFEDATTPPGVWAVNLVHIAGLCEGDTQLCTECGSIIGPWTDNKGTNHAWVPGRFVLHGFTNLWDERPLLRYSPWVYTKDDYPCPGWSWSEQTFSLGRLNYESTLVCSRRATSIL